MRILTLFLLQFPILLAQARHPSMVITPDMLSAMKQRARSNTLQWQKLRGSTSPLDGNSCEYVTQYAANTPDHLPPVYGFREPIGIYGTPAGYLRTGTDGNNYQGGEAASSMLNLAACYLTLKDGDVDLAGSASGTSDEVALANKYATQALKILDRFTLPYAKIIPDSPPKVWEGFDWMPVYYVDTTPSDTTGCTVPGEKRVIVYMRVHALAAGDSLTLGGILGGLSSLNGQRFRVSSTGLTSVQFELEDSGGNPVCSSQTGVNYNFDFLNDDAYPLRYGMGPTSLVYDWLNSMVSPTLKGQILDSNDAWYRHSMILDSSSRYLSYETHSQSNYHWGFFNAYGLAGVAFHGEDPRADVWYDHWRNVMVLGRDQPFIARWLGNNGSFMEAWQYFSLGMHTMIMTLLADQTAMGDDLFHHPTQPLMPFFMGQLEYLKHNLQPSGHAMLEINTTGYAGAASQVPFESNRVSPTSLYPLSYLADLEKHPLKDKFRKFTQDIATYAASAGGYPPTRDTSQYIAFLFFDPNGPMAAWDGEPRQLPNMSSPAGGYLHLFMRSGWDDKAIVGSFFGGVNTADAGNGKEMNDRGRLQVQRGSVHLLVNPRGECFRNLPSAYTTPAQQAQAANAMACYSTVQTQGANPAYLGSTVYSVFYIAKPGQQDGPLKFGIQTGKPQIDGTYMPWTPSADTPPDQQLRVTVNPATSLFTVTDGLPPNAGIANGAVAYYTYGDGASEGVPPGGISRGVKYYIRQLSGNSFKLATANSDTAILQVTSAGTGSQYVFAGNGPANHARTLTFTQPVRIDRFSSADDYVYARAVNLHKMYTADPVYTTFYPMTNWTREVVYLRPKLFIVHDRTQKTQKTTGTTKNISAISDTTPIAITTTAAHGYHTGMLVVVAGTSVTGANGAWTITVSSATSFTLDKSAASGAAGAGGTVSGTIMYQPVMAWTTGKTPQPADSPAGTSRYVVSDGGTFKGAITTVLPTSQTTSVRDVGGYGMVYQIQVAAPMESDTNNWLTVVDAAASEPEVSSVTKLAGNGIDAVLVGSNQVVGFIASPESLPISYTVPGTGSRTHVLAGLDPETEYLISSDSDGQTVIRNSGTGGRRVTSGSDGVLRFTVESDHAALLAGAVSHQALLRYQAPDSQPCQLEASPTPTYDTMIEDLDPTMFPGVDQDGGGRSARFAVLGSRAALDAGTTYYFRATCGANVVETSFSTAPDANSRPVDLPIQTKPPARLNVASLLVEYGADPASLNHSVTTACQGTCATTLPVSSNSILFVRYTAKDQQGRTLGVSSINPVVVP